MAESKTNVCPKLPNMDNLKESVIKGWLNNPIIINLFNKKCSKSENESYNKWREKLFVHIFNLKEKDDELLNCDKRINIYENLKTVKSKINNDCKNIILLNQIHSNKFIFINKNYKKKRKFKADAIITNQKKLPIGVLTADCVPILIYDKKKNIIAAIHAGWKGAYKGIIKKVLDFMLKKGCKRENITITIGPSIAQKNYEVKRNFMNKFIKRHKKKQNFLSK